MACNLNNSTLLVKSKVYKTKRCKNMSENIFGKLQKDLLKKGVWFTHYSEDSELGGSKKYPTELLGAYFPSENDFQQAMRVLESLGINIEKITNEEEMAKGNGIRVLFSSKDDSENTAKILGNAEITIYDDNEETLEVARQKFAGVGTGRVQ